jgi:hypothetical protein
MRNAYFRGTGTNAFVAGLSQASFSSRKGKAILSPCLTETDMVAIIIARITRILQRIPLRKLEERLGKRNGQFRVGCLYSHISDAVEMTDLSEEPGIPDDEREKNRTGRIANCQAFVFAFLMPRAMTLLFTSLIERAGS